MIVRQSLADVPPGERAVALGSFDGVHRGHQAVIGNAVSEAEARGLRVFDATCPLVTKVHIEVTKMHEHGREIVMIGHAGHPEVQGTMGQVHGRVHLVQSPADADALEVAELVKEASRNAR